MIRLGDLVLPDNIIWENRYAFPKVVVDTERTIDGEEVVFAQSVKGRPIDLVAYEDMGWLTHEQVEVLFEMASVPNAVYLFVYEDFVTQVRFRHEDSPVIDVQPIVPRPNPSEEDFYTGTIKLMEV